jgi:hypothetical protein
MAPQLVGALLATFVSIIVPQANVDPVHSLCVLLCKLSGLLSVYTWALRIGAKKMIRVFTRDLLADIGVPAQGALIAPHFVGALLATFVSGSLFPQANVDPVLSLCVLLCKLRGLLSVYTFFDDV